MLVTDQFMWASSDAVFISLLTHLNELLMKALKQPWQNTSMAYLLGGATRYTYIRLQRGFGVSSTTTWYLMP